jgi:hypothetical protein
MAPLDRRTQAELIFRPVAPMFGFINGSPGQPDYTRESEE